MAKSKNKFKKGDIGYSMSTSLNSIPGLDRYAMGVIARGVHVTECTWKNVTGYVSVSYANLKHMTAEQLKENSFYKLTDRKIADLKDWDIICLKHVGPVRDLLTRSELKIEMIKYIANDFCDEDPNTTYEFNRD